MAAVKKADKFLPVITQKEIETLKSSRRCVYVYHRKGLVCVDGGKYYRLKS